MRPFIVLSLALAVTNAAAQTAGNTRPPIPYPTVAAALADLRAKSDVRVSEQSGFMVIEEPAARAMWTFTPAGHAAHPAVIRREVVQRDGDIFVRMQVKCEATKAACDQLVAEFQALNERLRQSLGGNRAR